LKEERDADVRMATLNARLKEMIRQGKEALGTKIEVEGDEGGWEDEEWIAFGEVKRGDGRGWKRAGEASRYDSCTPPWLAVSLPNGVRDLASGIWKIGVSSDGVDKVALL
jgi:hypothetical protein